MNVRRKARTNKILLYGVLVIMSIVALFPILFCISASLRTQENLFQSMFPFTWRSLVPTEITFNNYITIFRDFNFIRPIINSLIVTIATIILGCFFNSIAAFALTSFQFRGRTFVRLLIMVSFMVPFEAIAIPLYSVVDSLGLVNTYAGMILPAAADGLVAFLFIQFFKDIPTSFIEAARIDGAKWPHIYFKIIMPICVPVFITAGLMIFMNQWNSYLWPLLVGRAKEIRTLQIALSEFRGEYAIQWTYIYAGSAISALIPIILFLPLQKYFVEGITAGGVKG